MKVNFKNEKQHSPTLDEGFAVEYAGAKRAQFKMRWYLLLAVLVSPLVALAYYFIDTTLVINADGILTSEPATLIAAEDGIVKKINYYPGDVVPAGSQIFIFESKMLDQQLAFHNEKIASYEALLGASRVRLKSLHEKNIERFNAANIDNLDFEKEYFDNKYRNVVPLTDRIGLHLARLEVDSKHINAEIAYAQAMDVQEAEGLAKNILQLKSERIRLNAQRNLLSIQYPKTAQLNELFIHEGEFVGKGESLVAMQNRYTPIVIVYLRPSRIDYAAQGNTATVTLPNGRRLLGVINRPAQVAEKVPAMLSGPFDGAKAALKVQIDLKEVVPQFVEGLPVKVRFHYRTPLKDWFLND